MRAFAILLLLAATPAAAQPSAPAMTADARAHWERGIAAYRAHDYRVARDELAACYRAEPIRECLFAWAQAARLDGDCATASALYRRYLDAALTAKQADAARAQLAVCEATLRDAPPAAAPAPSPPPPAPSPAPAIMPPTPAPTLRWYRDPWTLALLGTGSASLVGASILYAVAARDASSHPSTYDDYADRLATARTRRTTSIVIAGAGAALVTTGILRALSHDSAPAIALDVGASQVHVHYARAF